MIFFVYGAECLPSNDVIMHIVKSGVFAQIQLNRLSINSCCKMENNYKPKMSSNFNNRHRPSRPQGRWLYTLSSYVLKWCVYYIYIYIYMYISNGLCLSALPQRVLGWLLLLLKKSKLKSFVRPWFHGCNYYTIRQAVCKSQKNILNDSQAAEELR